MTKEMKPWDIPIKKTISTLPIVVFVYNLNKNDEVIHQIDLDLSEPDDRKYLGKLTAWAVTNHCSVETFNKCDANGE